MSLKDEYREPTLPEIGVHFDVHVTQVERPNMVFIQRLFHSEDVDGPFANDNDETEEIAREQQDEYHRMATLMNSEGFFDDASVLESIEPGIFLLLLVLFFLYLCNFTCIISYCMFISYHHFDCTL